jgi:hypothetical protein
MSGGAAVLATLAALAAAVGLLCVGAFLRTRYDRWKRRAERGVSESAAARAIDNAAALMSYVRVHNLPAFGWKVKDPAKGLLYVVEVRIEPLPQSERQLRAPIEN